MGAKKQVIIVNKNNKRSELEFLLSNIKSLPIIILTECWSNGDEDFSFICNRGYNVFHVDRERVRGGGCAVCIPQQIASIYKPSNYHSSPLMEAMYLDLIMPNGKIRLLNIYRPPGAFHNTPNELVAYIENAMVDKIPIVIFGDFNFPNIDWENYNSKSTYMGQTYLLKK